MEPADEAADFLQLMLHVICGLVPLRVFVHETFPWHDVFPLFDLTPVALAPGDPLPPPLQDDIAQFFDPLGQGTTLLAAQVLPLAPANGVFGQLLGTLIEWPTGAAGHA